MIGEDLPSGAIEGMLINPNGTISRPSVALARRIRDSHDRLIISDDYQAATGATAGRRGGQTVRTPGRISLTSNTSGAQRFAADQASGQARAVFPRMAAAREAVFDQIVGSHLVKRGAGEPVQARTMASAIRTALSPAKNGGRELMELLFTPAELAEWERFAALLDNIATPEGAARSGTPGGLRRMVAGFFRALFAVPNAMTGGLAGGLLHGIGQIAANSRYVKDARRFTAPQPLPRPGRLPGGRVLRSAKVDTIYDLPPQAQRSFNLDYPGAVHADESGRLLADIEGRPLLADDIAGRRMVQGGDVPLPRARTDGLAGALTGRAVSRINGGTDAGILYRTRGPNGPEFEISVRPGPDSPGLGRDRVIRHEIGHVIDELVGNIDSQGLNRELHRIFDAGLSGRLRGGAFTTPERIGYSAADSPRELWAEAIRAYMTDPNALKAIAPRVAARIRASVNANPRLARIIQFNALPLALAAGAGAGAAIVGADSAQAQERDELVSAQTNIARIEAEMALIEEGSRNRSNRELVTRVQELLQGKGAYGGNYEPDGDWGHGTQNAVESVVPQLKTELERARGMLSNMRQDLAAQNTRPSDLQQALQTWGPNLGFLAGGYFAHSGLPIPRRIPGIGRLSGWGGRESAVREAGVEIAERNRAANLRLPPRGREIPRAASNAAARERMSRAANMNEFYQQGGAGDRVPFDISTDNTGFTARPNAMPASRLYQPALPPGLREFGLNDVGAMATAGVESGYIENVLLPDARSRLEEAEDAAKSDPESVEKRRAVNEARENIARLEFFQRAGLGYIAGRTIAPAFRHSRYPTTRPNVSRAESEVMELNRFLAPRPPRAPRKKPK